MGLDQQVPGTGAQVTPPAAGASFTRANEPIWTAHKKWHKVSQKSAHDDHLKQQGENCAEEKEQQEVGVEQH